MVTSLVVVLAIMASLLAYGTNSVAKISQQLEIYKDNYFELSQETKLLKTQLNTSKLDIDSQLLKVAKELGDFDESIQQELTNFLLEIKEFLN